MATVTLAPDALLIRRDGEGVEVQPHSVEDLLPYLTYSVEVDPAFVLGDLFRLVDRHDSELLDVILAEEVGPLLDEARSGPQTDADDSVEYLQVYNNHADGRVYRHFDGWGRWDEPYEGAWAENAEHAKQGGIAVELAPVTELLHLPLRYNPELVFRRADYEVEYRTEIEITFIEFLKAVFYELTFCGTPEERDAQRTELQELVARIERGEERLIPAEEVYRELGLAENGETDETA
jgi:hypothetical protein